MSVVAAATLALGRATWLADDTDVGDETHKAGPIAILVVAVLCVACFVLFRSMTKHLRRVREEFPDDGAGDTAAADPAATDTAGSADVTGRAHAALTSADPPPAAGSSRAAPKSRPRADDSASR